jgi:carboxyl-terminal processing protease
MTMPPELSHAASLALPLLADAAVKGTALLLVALALAVCLRRASSAARHLLWASALGGLLVLPVLSACLPRWAVPATARAEAAPEGFVALPDAPAPAAGQPVLVASRGATPPAALLAAGRQPAADAPPQTSQSAAGAAFWLVGAWLAGALGAVLWMAAGLVSLARLARRCERVADGPLAELVGELAAGLGLRRGVVLLLSPRACIPMTWGLLRPVILLPREALSWPAERLRLVLLHELGHVRRSDCLTQRLGHLSRGLYWFHPLAWWALARLRAEQENACDDLVLGSGASAPDYAEHLVAVTAGRPAYRFAAPVALGMGRATRLRRRLGDLLDPTRKRAPVTRRGVLGSCLLSLALLLPAATAGLPSATAAAPDETAETQKQPAPAKATPSLKALAEVEKKLRELYVNPIDEKQLTDAAIRGLLKGLHDPYTDYVPAADLKQFESQIKQRLTGIGAQLKMEDQRLVVVSPLEDSPALKAGLRPGDQIQAIDGKSTQGLSMADAIGRILGEAGTVVKLKVVHPEGVVEELAVTRAAIRLRSVQGFRRGDGDRWVYSLDPGHKVAYVSVQQFGATTAQELRETLRDLQKAGLKGLILDLRFCPGGLLEEAIAVCKIFIAEGTILTTRGANKKEFVWKADGKGALENFPLVVLVNEQTASSAEIVAAALQDHKRAVVLGTRTYGKGSVQAVVGLKDGGALKVTTAYHYRPSGRTIQKRPGEERWGVDPDDGFVLPLSRSQLEALQRDQQRRAVVGLKKEERPVYPAHLTPKVLEEQHADPQLAAALRTMVANLTGGEFIKVGKAAGSAGDTRLEEMRRRREALRDDLQRLDREIEDLRPFDLPATEPKKN